MLIYYLKFFLLNPKDKKEWDLYNEKREEGKQ